MMLDPASHKPRFRGAYRVAALLAVLVSSGAAGDDVAVLQSRRHRIEMMSQAELNRLKRNYEMYLQLSPERRQQMVRLHEELQQDAKSGGQLQKLLDGYNQWLQTLSLFDRETLLGTADPSERAEAARKLHDEQLRQERARKHEAAFPALVARAAHTPDGRMALTPAELEIVLRAVESNFLDEESKQNLPKLPAGRDRHLQILKLAMKQVQRNRATPETAANGGNGEKGGQKMLVAILIAALPGDSLKTWAQGQPPARLGQLIRQSILAEWRPELESAPPTQEQLQEFIETSRTNLINVKRRQAFEDRLKRNPKFAAMEFALANNPELQDLRQVVNGLLRTFSPERPFGGRFPLGDRKRGRTKGAKAAPQSETSGPPGL